MPSRSFDAVQNDAAMRFLQTVLVVDDQVVTEPLPDPDPDPQPLSGLRAPGPPAAALPQAAEEDHPTSAAADRRTPEAGPEAGSDLNVKRLADRFADLGLTCGVLQPRGEAKAEDRIVTAASRVDILIIDWLLDVKTGETAGEAIRRIVQAEPHSRRIIAVYTTQRDLRGIIRTLTELLPHADETDDELTLNVGGTQISVRHKGGVALEGLDKAFVVDEQDLPGLVVDKFVEVSRGLVSAVALNALAATRENTHRLLRRLNSGLDLGYGGHLLRMEHPDDGAEHLLDAVSGELRAIVEDDDRTRATAGSEGFNAWLVDRDAAGQLSATLEELETVQALNVAVDREVEKWREKHERFSDVEEEDLSGLLAPIADAEIARNSDGNLAMVLSLRRPYDRPDPGLHLGAIVRDLDEPKNYWLCVQPVCDSVRLPRKPRAFPMLPLELATTSKRGQLFHFVVPEDEGDALKHLWSPGKPFDMTMMNLKANKKGAVHFLPSEDHDGRRVVEAEEGHKLVWVAQLKPVHAQRVAEVLAGQLSRVGLEESEWLRLRSQNGQPPGRRKRTVPTPASDGSGEVAGSGTADERENESDPAGG
jgi:hypothetical protein